MYEKEMIVVGTYLKRVLNIEFDIIIMKKNNNDEIMTFTNGNNIYIVEDWINQIEDEFEIIAMLAHEAFHIWQRKAILEGSLPPDIHFLWQKEFNHYISPDKDINGHWNQNIEKTATIFSDIVLNKIADRHLAVRNKFEAKDILFVKNLNFNYLF